MKKVFYKITALLTLTLLAINIISLTTFAKSSTNKLATNQINNEMLKSQITLFKSALDEFGAASPTAAAEIWASGEKTRNGVMQYSVSSKAMKSKMIKELGDPSNNLWVIGVSSPWVKKYEIVNTKKITNINYQIKIKYYWATSNGDETPTITTLTLTKENNYWCVKKAV